MAQVFSGEGLGLRSSSIDVLGGYGPKGQASFGQAKTKTYINANNGNLVLQAQDGFLADHNLAEQLLQSYNSQSGTSAWVFNVGTSLSFVSGTLNQAGSSIARIDEAGHVSRFVYDEKSQQYLAQDDAKARLVFDGSLWHYRQGSNTVEWRYNAQGQLIEKANADGLTTRYRYEANRLVEIFDASGQTIQFNYQGDKLCEIRSISQDKVVHCLRYDYDAKGRLTRVHQAIGDGVEYTIQYRYDGDSNRISQVQQSDGSIMRFEYDSKGRVILCSDAQGRLQRFSYSDGKTIVSNNLNEQWVYYYNTRGQLTATEGPEAFHIAYKYNDEHHLEQVVQGSHVWRFDYNAQGDCIRIPDETGRVTTRTFNSQHQLVSESHYLQRDDNSNTQKTATAYWVYDEKGHLSYSISTLGAVTQYRYDAQGNQIERSTYLSTTIDLNDISPEESPKYGTLKKWCAAHQNFPMDRSVFTYDFRGQIASEMQYRQVSHESESEQESVFQIRYCYDASGNLLEKTRINDSRSSTVSYVYDDLGRLLQSTDSQGNTQRIEYDDAHQKIVKTASNGLQTIELYDRSGLLLSSHQLSSTQDFKSVSYRYDAAGRLLEKTLQDGSRCLYFYDAQGRCIATVSAQGQVEERRYDSYGNVIERRQFDTLLDLDAKAKVPQSFSELRPQKQATDRLQYAYYNDKNQLQYEIGAQGMVCEYQYDSNGNCISKHQYAKAIAVDEALINHQSIAPVKDEADRIQRYYFNAAGQCIAKVDGESFATQFSYDNRGLLLSTRRFYSPVVAAQGEWETIKPDDHRKDILSYIIYDNNGLKVAQIDPEGYLTAFKYNAQGQLIESYAYYTKLRTPYDEKASLDELRPAKHDNDHWTRYKRDDCDQIISERHSNGLSISYTYNTQGQVLEKRCEDIHLQQLRIQKHRYDSLGRITASLDEIGCALLECDTIGDENIASIWAQHAQHFDYDVMGRLITKTNQLGQSTYYYYEQGNQWRYSINNDGAVIERSYNNFGQLSAEIHYSTLLTLPSEQRFETQDITQRLQAVSNVAQDEHRYYLYNTLGQLVHTGFGQSEQVLEYNAFGEQSLLRKRINANLWQESAFSYDHRGLQTHRISDAAGHAYDWTNTYDAFGRIIKEIGPYYQQSRDLYYDKKGNLRIDDNALTGIISYSYDAFARKTSDTERGGSFVKNNYKYLDAQNKFVVEHSEGGIITTCFNAFGDTIEIVNPKGDSRKFHFDVKGQLAEEISPDGGHTQYHYDAAGLLRWQSNAVGQKIAYSYDAAEKLLSKTFDPEGLAITTHYQYDGAHRSLKFTNEIGTVTRYEYDASGQLTRSIIDPDGLSIVSEYEYNAAGNKTLERHYDKEKLLRSQSFVYDALERLISSIVDPDGLALSTSFSYDANGNLCSKVDPSGHSEVFIFDADNRCRYNIDANGNVTEHQFNRAGYEVATVRYAQKVDLKQAYTLQNIADFIEINTDLDQIEQRLFDDEGRMILHLDAMGYLSRYSYDVVGNMIKTIQYPQRYKVKPGTYFPDPSDQSGAQVHYFTYDKAQRLRFSVTSHGQVSEQIYDLAGNVIKKIQYSKAISFENISDYTDNAAINDALTPDLTSDRTERFEYDSVGRLSARMDAIGQVQVFTYDALGNAVQTITYAQSIAKDSASLHDAVAHSMNDRCSRRVFDAAGRERFSISSIGRVMERRYDASGNVITEIAHASILPNTLKSLAEVEHYFKDSNLNDRVQAYSYDAADRLSSKNNAQGLKESFDYDRSGNVISKRDTAGQIWHYEYDDCNQKITMHSPKVQLSYFENGNLKRQTRSIETAFVYDAFGNVIQKISDKGFQNQSLYFEYDGLNRTIKTIVKNVAIDVSGGAICNTRNEQRVNLTTETVFDAFNQVRASKDRAGHWQHFVYNELGQQQFTVDSQGNTTEFRYDTFGNKISQTRYAKAITFPEGHLWNPDEISLTASSDDRHLQYQYDANGLCIEEKANALRSYDPLTQQYDTSISPTTRYRYNAFGERISEQRLRAANDWIETRYFYNAEGEQSACLDAEHYLTQYQYNSFGELSEQCDYSTVTQASADGVQTPNASVTDRIQRFEYDALGNLTVKRLKNVSLQRNVKNKIESYQADVVTRYTYNALNQMTSIKDALGNSSYFYYDAVGNVSAKVGPKKIDRHRAVRFEYDALGNAVLEHQYASGASDATVDNYTLNAVNALDRVTQSNFDANNRLIEQIQPGGFKRAYSYDANGNMTRSFQTIHNASGQKYLHDIRFQYDSQNRQQSCITIEKDGSISKENVRFNAFGEAVEKNSNGQFKTHYEYDTQGRVWRSNSEGHDEIFVYDLVGNVTQVVRASNSFQPQTKEQGVDLSSDEFKQAISFDKDTYKQLLQRCNNRYDKLGHLNQQTREVMETVDAQQGPHLRQDVQQYSCDRWGNVLRYIDALNNTSVYQYNVFDAVLSKQLPTVEVMDAHGKRSMQSPIFYYAYDALGRCIAMQDAKGSVQQREYDAYGQRTREIDGLQFSRYKEYDAFGNIIETREGDNQHRTRFGYDANNSLEIIINAKGEKRLFKNDELGRRLSEENGSVGAALQEKTSCEYDNHDRVIKKIDPRGNTQSMQYDAAGHLIRTVDAEGNSQHWSYNDQGRLESQRDLAGKLTRYRYNSNGLLLSETSDYGKHQEYHYNADGSLRQFEDKALKQVVNYRYDANGNILSKTSSQGEDNAIKWILESDYYEYDALGRIHSVTRKNPEVKDRNTTLFTIKYDYDISNNIRRIQSEVDYYQKGSIKNDYYFSYDANNRMLVNKGALVNGEIVITTTQGTKMHYDASGNLAQATHYEDGHYKSYLYDHDALGRTYRVRKYLDGHANKATRIKQVHYDGAGHVFKEIQFDSNDNKSQTNSMVYEQGLLKKQHSYGAFGQLRSSLVYDLYDANGNLAQYRMIVHAIGNTIGYSTIHFLEYKKGASYLQSKDNARTDYTNGQSTAGSSVRSYDSNGNLARVVDASGTHSAEYLNDSKEGIRAKKQGQRYTSYLNVGGHIIADVSLDKGSGKQTLDVYAGFTPKGSASNESAGFVNQGKGGGLFSLGESYNSIEEFQDAMAYKQALHQDSTGVEANLDQDSFGSYTLQSGDSLRSVALNVYGDASLWYLIADANGISDANAVAGQSSSQGGSNASMQLQSGMSLIIPAANTSQHMSNATHKVYNPNAIIGDTSASTPSPTPIPAPPAPNAKHHHWWKKILVVVIGAIAAIATGGIAAAALSSLGVNSIVGTAAGVGFAAGTGGNLVGQMVSMGLGMQEGVSLKSALLSGLATAASAGVGAVASGTALGAKIGQSLEGFDSAYFKPMSAATAMASETALESVEIAMHGKGHLDWKQIGISGLSQGISESQRLKKLDNFELMRDLSFNAASQAMANHGHIDSNSLAGNTLGRTIVGLVNQPQSQKTPSPIREKDENGLLLLTDEDRQQLQKTIDTVHQLDLNPIDDGSNPNLVHVMIAFDGTANDRDQMEYKTNPAILADLFEKKNGGYVIYEKGVGTDFLTKIFGGITGLGAKQRIFEAHDQLTTFINDVSAANSDSKFALTITGFSRGSAEAREFANYLVEQGIVDTSSKVNGHYTRTLPTPRIGAMLLYDTVASIGIPGANVNLGYRLDIPKEAEHVLHIIANDEQRRYFPLSSVISENNMEDERIMEIAIPGSHSDIGGGFANAYSYFALDMGYTFLQKLALPLKVNSAFSKPSINDKNLRLHDSRYVIDKLIHSTQKNYNYQPNRMTYYANYF